MPAQAYAGEDVEVGAGRDADGDELGDQCGIGGFGGVEVAADDLGDRHEEHEHDREFAQPAAARGAHRQAHLFRCTRQIRLGQSQHEEVEVRGRLIGQIVSGHRGCEELVGQRRKLVPVVRSDRGEYARVQCSTTQFEIVDGRREVHGLPPIPCGKHLVGALVLEHGGHQQRDPFRTLGVDEGILERRRHRLVECAFGLGGPDPRCTPACQRSHQDRAVPDRLRQPHRLPPTITSRGHLASMSKCGSEIAHRGDHPGTVDDGCRRIIVTGECVQIHCVLPQFGGAGGKVDRKALSSSLFDDR